MKIRSLMSALAVIAMVTALGGCVSYGNTHALITPVGAAGYHIFKPKRVDTPRNDQFPQTPDRIAAASEAPGNDARGNEAPGNEAPGNEAQANEDQKYEDKNQNERDDQNGHDRNRDERKRGDQNRDDQI